MILTCLCCPQLKDINVGQKNILIAFFLLRLPSIDKFNWEVQSQGLSEIIE